MLGNPEQKKLLNLARKSIEYYSLYRDFLVPDDKEFDKPVYQDELGVFVTLFEKKQLRGCIGNIYGVEPLYISVLRNAVNAGFYDPRFYPLEPNEINQIDIEISILSKPKELRYQDVQELVEILLTTKPGVVIKKVGYSAIFLPQVWEDITEPVEFLEHLCRKASLNKDCWKSNEIKILTYTVESFKESQYA